MAKEEDQRGQTTNTWGTWEELLLASAVKRHGFKDWDSVAMEVQARCSLPHLLTTAHNCELKYRDLKRRFTRSLQNDAVDSLEKDNGTVIGHRDDNIPWLEELRQLRVAELRREVRRYDVSILSLQSKVKRLEEERERCSKEKENGEEKPDLEEESREERSENDKNGLQEPDGSEPVRTDAKAVVRDGESDREDQSVNESNSTGSKICNGKTSEENTIETKPDSNRSDGQEPVRRESKPVGADSDNGSSDTVAKNPTCERLKPSQEKKADELQNSAAQSDEGEEGARDSGEVQSSASLTGKKKRNIRLRKEISGGSSCDEPPPPPETVKSEQFDEVLRIIRAHKHGSLFEFRLQSQDTDKYRNIVRQHIDLETIRTRLQKGSYSSSTFTFYRDILLLLNNAITFFPKSSLESITAHELRHRISNILKRTLQVSKQDPSSEPAYSSPPIASEPKFPDSERSGSLLGKHKSSNPIIVCRKRSSISAKPSSGSFGLKSEHNNEEKKLVFDLKPPVNKPASNVDEDHGFLIKDNRAKEKPVTGTRSMRRSNNDNLTETSTPSAKKQNTSDSSKAGSVNKLETSRPDKKKTEAVALDKKRSAADFLKRIKRNSPAEILKSGTRGGGNSSGGGEQKKKSGGKGGDKEKGRVLRQSSDKKNAKEDSVSPSKRNVGRPPKKAVEINVGSTKRAREGGGSDGKEAAPKRPRKRSRR